ncbi:MAG: DUF1993 domain-containing protein [Hyphomonas sp.]|nr:DUF1993 domain-containing protein [Hyphomonas sp.]
MSNDLAEATTQSIKYYLDRTEHLIARCAQDHDPDRPLAIRLAPDMLDTGFNFALAIQFAARALCPPAGLAVPEIPDIRTCETLLRFKRDVSDLIAPIGVDDLARTVDHTAGDAALTQASADYVARFAVPNMIFHLSIAYAGLRHGGMDIGKSDFDGLHAY